jgi:HPr kinase/phosphorylase
MRSGITVQNLLAGSEKKLALRQVVGQSGLSNRLRQTRVRHYCRQGVRIPLQAQALLIMTGDDHLPHGGALEEIRMAGVPCIFLSESHRVPRNLTFFSEENSIPVLASHFDGYILESRLKGLFREKMQHRIMIHGVLLKMFGMGVLITGESGVGKTSAALKLVRNGHLWIADDAVEIAKKPEDVLYARGFRTIRDLIDLKQAGVFCIHDLLAPESLCQGTVLHLVVEISPDEPVRHEHDPETDQGALEIMGIQIPRLQIRAGSGRKCHAGDIEQRVRAFRFRRGLL